ncbi:hypothetical protein SSX86_021766 [Deinandra increscens subsp. villosa]|uniref:CCHC-type domain-containing protein n=1 Tax=Deinandra increscens subsp. villosa TaxID=3103831 RepID=A0AAP0CRX5_9ASTR
MVEESVSIACSNVHNHGNPSSFSFGREITITNAKQKLKSINEITRTQNDVKEVKEKEENGVLKDTGTCLEIDHLETSNNYVLRKLLSRPRYFDPPDSDYGNCYNCGEGGHTITNCTAANRKKPCFLCGSLKHNGKQCKQRKVCFYCKKGGHYARNCPDKSIEEFEKAKICLKCGDSGHEIYDCESVFYSVDDLKVKWKYNVTFANVWAIFVVMGTVKFQVKFLVTNVVSWAILVWYVKCESVSSSAIAHAEASSSFCYKCGQEGHKSRKCKTFAKKRKRKNAKRGNLQDNTDNVGVRSATQELGEACKRNKTQHGYSTET